MFLGMVCIRLLLQTYGMSGWWIFFIQIATLFATPLLHYTVYDSAYSHVYSFFLISWFMYTVRKYFSTNQPKYLFLSLIVFGLIIIVRPVNILVLLFTPLLVDHLPEFITKIKCLFTQHYRSLLLGIFCCGMIVSIQFYISYLQTGNPFDYSYGEEGFHFRSPHLLDFLFSYHKGFFLWTPWWLIGFILGLSCWIYTKRYDRTLVFLLAFFVVVYVLSSWHAWSYGGSIGQRPMIDFYGAFILALIPVFSKKSLLNKWILVISFPFLVALMQIQTFQYVKAIILWDGMNKEIYWKAFLITDEKYSWYFYRPQLTEKVVESEQVVAKEVVIHVPQQQAYVQTFDISSADTLAPYGEVKLRINREADREFATIQLLDSTAQIVTENAYNIFHSQYGNNVVYNINPSYNFKTSFPLKVLASYSTAFITPSLYQLYSEYGNTNLTPEENATIEAGFETELWNKKIKLSAVGFYRDQNDAIDFFYNPDTFEAYYVNVDGKSKAKGVETTVSVALTEKVSLNGNYTFTQVDKALDRLIPKHKANASIDFQPTKRTLFNLNYQYFNARNDAFYNGTTFAVDTIQLGSYQLLNALAKYELIQNRLTVFGTVTNIFNEEFVENAGYSTRGRNFKLGVNIVL